MLSTAPQANQLPENSGLSFSMVIYRVRRD